jgi:small-conductance mechanosensitive channel
MTWNELWLRLGSWIAEPAYAEGFGPDFTVAELLALVAWTVAAVFSWWFVRWRTHAAEVPGAHVFLRLTALVLRWVAPALCLILALDTSGIFPAFDLVHVAKRLTDTRLFELGGSPVRVSDIGVLIAILIGTFWGTAVLYRASVDALRQRGVNTSGTVGTLLNLGRYAVLVIGSLVALATASIDVSALFTVGAVFAVTIGFALQSLTQNFVSGIILLVEGTISPGDILEVEGRVVKVVKLGIRSTIVRSLDDEDLIVPNSVLAQGTVKNLTMLDDELRIRVDVQVAYASDLDRVYTLLADAARGVALREPSREPVVFLEEFGSSGVGFAVFVWVADPWTAPRARSDLRFAVWRALKNGGITIPFPQVDVHLDPSRAP